MACRDRLTIDLQTSDGQRFAEGTYTVEVVANGGGSSVTCTIPASGPGNCSDSGTPALSVTSDGSHIVVDFFDSHPESMTVRLQSAGKIVGEQTFSPAYAAQKSGPYDDCPICQRATQTVTVKP
jgi:hypothetical protein